MVAYQLKVKKEKLLNGFSLESTIDVDDLE